MGVRRIGFEFEYPIVVPKGQAITRRDARAFWEGAESALPGWTPIRQQQTDATIGLARTRGGFAEHISNDTGVCTVEFALKPEETIPRAVDLANRAIRRVSDMAAGLDLRLLCMGLQPITWADAQRKTAKDAYRSFAARMPYHTWSVPMASHQCSVDVAPSAAISVVNSLNALSGLIIALTSSSPIAKGACQEWHEFRTWISDERSRRLRPTDRHYYSNGLPPRPFADWNDYVDWFWASTMYFVKDDSGTISIVAGRRSFRQFVSSPAPAAVWSPRRPVRYVEPALAHVNEVHGYGWLASRLRYTLPRQTTMDEIRAAVTAGQIGDFMASRIDRCYVEFRASGVSEQGTEGSVGALVLGLVEQHEAAEHLRRERAWEAWRQLRIDGSVQGIRCVRPGGEHHRLATRMIDIAGAGLRQRGFGEERLLEPLLRRIESGVGYSDRIRTWFQAGGVRRVIDETAWRADALRLAGMAG
ncbi:glutamate-cysteine ligase family protein [Dactylosporangium sp. NPDC005572]|uniref:glutamate-cysteine ligase family protein n=1 Tax=Dactylosporangium sp. NPDC005572 TaxID=3156889 RepID=UPI0033B4FBEA